MKDLVFTINIILPLAILLALGYFLKFINLFNEEFLRIANDLTFKVLLPALLFYNVFTADITEAFIPKTVLFATIGIVVIFLGLMIIIPLFMKDKKRIPVLIQGIFRSNFILFGVPLSEMMFGAQGAAAASVVAALYVPLINILSTLILFIYSDVPDKSLAKVFKGIITNPLVLGGFLGIICSLVRGWTGFVLPSFLNKALFDLKTTATPIAFIVLGADMKFASMFQDFKYVLGGISGKLLFIPLIALPVAYLMGYRGLDFAILVATFSTPNAVSSYAMAIKFRADHKLAGELVVASTLFSIITMFIFIYLSKTLGII